jgi:hypothetical protein
MVLRFSCPCGAPYALADHLAGRTFTCTSCGTVLQIGTVPAPPAAAPPPPAAPNLRQSGVAKPPSGGGPQPNVRQSGVAPPQSPAASRKSGVGAALPPPPPKTNELALADDDPPPPLKPLDDEEEEDDEDDEEGVYNSLEEDEPKPKKRPTSSAGGKAMRTSGVTKGTSGVGKGAGSARMKKTSAGHRALPPEPAGIATMRCPVCETEVPRVAASCHSCGVRLRAAGVGEKFAAGWKGPAKTLAMLAAAGTLGFIIWKAVEPTPPRRPIAGGGKPNTERPATERPATERPSTERPSTERPSTERPSTERTSTEEAPGTERPGTEQTPTTRPPPKEPKAPTEPKPPKVPTDKPPPKETTERRDPETATDRTAVSIGTASAGVTIPPGPQAADLERLRDAPQPLQPLLVELAANAELVAAAQATLAKSVDRAWHVRVLRLRLLAGDEAARRATITQLLTAPPDDEAQTLHLAHAALDLDPVGLDAALASIAYGTNGAGPARALIDLAKAGTQPPAGAVEAARGLLRWIEPDTLAVLAPVLLAGGDGSQLDAAHTALSGDSPTLKKVAAAALTAASVGSGPAGDDPGPWRTWIDEYRPRRDLLVKATTDAEARSACRVKAKELLPALGPFLREGGGQGAARVVADVIAMGAGPGDSPVLARLLDSLVLDAQSGTLVVRAALFAADEAVSDSVASVIARGGASVELLGPTCPDLLRPARGKALETLQTWAYGQSDPKVQKALQLVQASFRSPALETWALQPSDERAHRESVGARLASTTKVEAQLLKNNDGASLQLLAELCGEETADKLAKAYADAPRGDLAIAVRRCCDRKVVPRLKKLVETTADLMVGNELIEVFARVAGPEGGPSLLKRVKDGDPFQRQARTFLLKLGAKEALGLARPEFEAIEISKLPSSDALHTLLTAGEASDGALLRKCMSFHDKMPVPDQPWVIMGFGLLEDQASAQELRGYLRKDNKWRGQAAIALALLKDADSGGRIRAVVDAYAGKFAADEGMSFAALGALDPEGVGEALKKYPGEVVRTNDELLVVGASFGLARGGHDETLQVMARGAARKLVARGIALASLSKPGELPRLKLLDDLRTDPDPAIRAEGALAFAASKGEGGAREALLALATTPDEVLDSGRTKGILPIMALTPRGRELTTLRAGLWAAFAIAQGQSASPLLRVELPKGRQRELIRQARAATLR